MEVNVTISKVDLVINGNTVADFTFCVFLKLFTAGMKAGCRDQPLTHFSDCLYLEHDIYHEGNQISA